MGDTSYTEEAATTILERMSNGEPLRVICRDEGMPAESTVRRWATDDRDGFGARYARACDLRAEHLADELLEIADDGTGDTYLDEEGVQRVNSDVIQRSKLRVDTRRWLLSKMLPKKYGESSKLEVSGAGGGPIAVTVEFVDVDSAEGS